MVTTLDWVCLWLLAAIPALYLTSEFVLWIREIIWTGRRLKGSRYED